MSIFNPGLAYQPRLDVRFNDGMMPDWAEQLIAAAPPNGVCWLVVMPRRAGKTWLARAIATARGSRPTLTVDLRTESRATLGKVKTLVDGKSRLQALDGVVLIDEPALAPAQDGPANAKAATLAAGLRVVQSAGAVPIVFATPGELNALQPLLPREAHRDVLIPPALSALEIERMAARAPAWAHDVVATVRNHEPEWLRTPFLLELVLSVAERHPELRTDADVLLTRAAAYADGHQHEYQTQLFQNGLSINQRATIRRNRWRSAGLDMAEPSSDRVLLDSRVIDDPVLIRHLPGVLRIHHISDLHVGGRLRENIDQKDQTAAGRHFSNLAGAGTPLETYLAHLRELAARDRAPHLLLVTGDVVNRPEPRSAQQALAWLAEAGTLLAGHPDLSSDAPQVVLVGGNHDVDWGRALDPDPLARHRWFGRAFEAYPHPDLHVPDPEARHLEVRYPQAGLRLILLGSAESGGEVASDTDRAQLATAIAQLRDETDDQRAHELIQNMERFDPGIVARAVLNRVSEAPGFLTLALLHHPLSPVPTVEVAPYAGLLNAGQVKLTLARAKTALALHGHTHLTFFASERLLSGDQPGDAERHPWTLRVVGAGTLASAATDERNAYNQIFISREGGTHRLVVRPVELIGGQWIAGAMTGFEAGAPMEQNPENLVTDIIS